MKTWKDILEEQEKNGNYSCLPGDGEFNKDTRFKLVTVRIPDINSSLVFDFPKYKKFDCEHDIKALEGLLKAYKSGASVPPIVLGRDMELVDGFHRVAAHMEMGKAEIKAYVPE